MIGATRGATSVETAVHSQSSARPSPVLAARSSERSGAPTGPSPSRPRRWISRTLTSTPWSRCWPASNQRLRPKPSSPGPPDCPTPASRPDRSEGGPAEVVRGRRSASTAVTLHRQQATTHEGAGSELVAHRHLPPLPWPAHACCRGVGARVGRRPIAKRRASALAATKAAGTLGLAGSGDPTGSRGTDDPPQWRDGPPGSYRSRTEFGSLSRTPRAEESQVVDRGSCQMRRVLASQGLRLSGKRARPSRP